MSEQQQQPITITRSEIALIESLRQSGIKDVNDFEDYLGVFRDEVKENVLEEIDKDLEAKGVPLEDDPEGDSAELDAMEAEGAEEGGEEDEDEEQAPAASIKNHPFIQKMAKTIKRLEEENKQLKENTDQVSTSFTKGQFKAEMLEHLAKNEGSYQRLSNLMSKPDSSNAKRMVDVLFNQKVTLEKEAGQKVTLKEILPSQEESLKELEYNLRKEEYTPPQPKEEVMRVLPSQEKTGEQFKSTPQDVSLDGTAPREGNKPTEGKMTAEDWQDESKVNDFMENMVEEASKQAASV